MLDLRDLVQRFERPARIFGRLEAFVTPIEGSGGERSRLRRARNRRRAALRATTRRRRAHGRAPR